MHSTTNETALVKVEDLTVHFVSRDATVNAVNGVSFELARGEVLGRLGESGSGVAVEVSHKVAVMYAGRMVESGSVRDVVRNPRHPYTEGLMCSTVHEVAKGNG